MTRSLYGHLWLALIPAIIVIVGPGCVDPVEPPVLKVIKLRVVMLVEERANLDIPPEITGGCKLTQTQVKLLVDDLVKFGSNVGVEFDWNANAPDAIVKIESQCMRVNPINGPCFSQCGLPGVQFNCPRILDLLPWFTVDVLNHGSGGPLGLAHPGDQYDQDPCTLNIYFVGNFVLFDDQGGYFISAGYTLPPNPNFHDFVLINDGADQFPGDPPDFADVFDSRTLVHEVVCHWLPGMGDEGHVSPTSNNPCPDNLCIDGPTLDAEACSAQYGGIRPTHVGPTIQAIIDSNPTIQNCGGGP